MRLFNPVDSFDAPFAINRRQSSDCGGGGVGAGECLDGSSCKGLVYANQCRDTPGSECCLNRHCDTDRGSGWCKNTDNQTCAGEWVPGTPDHYPCPGPNYVVCCVDWDKLVNSTTSSNSPTSSSTQASSTSTSGVPTGSGSSTPVGGSGSGGGNDGGLSAAQKGGIAGGIVGAVAVTSIIFLVFFFLRRRRAKRAVVEQEAEAAKREGGQGGEEVERTATMTTGPDSPGGEGVETEAAMLASREKLELDASGRALHEMETPTTAMTGNLDEKAGALADEMQQVKAARLAELPGSLAVAEMPAPEENEPDKRDGEPGVRRD